MSMDHREAQETRATERYFLGEMTEAERFDFENHYFGCEHCADDVRAANALARGVKAVYTAEPDAKGVERKPAAREERRSGWLAWLAPASLIPSAVACALAAVAIYQGVVVIPGLRWQTGSRAMAPVVLRAAARGEEQALEIRRDQPVSLLSLDVNGPEPGTPLVYDVVAPGGAVRIHNRTQAPPLGSPLIVVLSNSEIRQTGSWVLVLRTEKGPEVARYPFQVQLK
jgi:hypothetical protein